MAYRIVILNGDRRGERLELETASLTLGRGPACDLKVSDPGIALLHAEILLTNGALSLQTCDAPLRVHVNNSEVRESPLKHGDVVEIGTLRLLIQEYTGSAAWKTITGNRRWVRVLLPALLIMAASAFMLARYNGSRKSIPPPTRPHPAPYPSATRPSWPDESFITNYPHIRPDLSIVLTTLPPELVEARILMNQLGTTPAEQDLAGVRTELAYGTQFLQDHQARQAPDPAASNRALAEAELIQARTALTNPVPQPNRTDP